MKTMIQEQKDLLIKVPKKINDTISLYVDDKFVDKLNVNQVCQYQHDILKYIYETGDFSILNRFYFIGHQDTNDEPGEEIKIQMDIHGNFSDSPYEMNYVRRYMLKILRMERKHFGEIK